MPGMKHVSEEFGRIRESLTALGKKLLEAYPQSEGLVELVEELNIANDALSELDTRIKQNIQQAEQEEALRKDLLEQMENSPIYKGLEKKEKDTLSEALIKTQKGLADQKMLEAYVKRSLEQSDVDELVAMYPKQTVIEYGKKVDPNADEFAAYTAGTEALKQQFTDNKEESIQRLSKLWFNRGMEAIVRDFYADVLKDADDKDKADE